jgi:hypothetical protein
MQKLKEANLYQSELIPISGKLVERYNDCLLKLGFSKTKLTSFSIDGLGWSPEISEEKEDAHYLNNGEANPHAIIITPQQKGLPIYVPFHTFDKELMKLVFKTYGDKIKDITRDSAICLDFDQKIDVFYEPVDVLKYEDVTVSFRIVDDLDEAQKEQKKMIEYFNRDNNFIDESLHQKLLQSAKKHGDLRHRNFELKDLHYATDSFYTKAFGGVYILKSFVLPMLIFESEETYQEAKTYQYKKALIFHISDSELMEKLQSKSLVECNLKVEVSEKKYDRIKKYIFSEYLEETNHPIKDILEDKMLFKSYLNKIDMKARKRVMGVELYLEKHKLDNGSKIYEVIDRDVYHALHSPGSSLPPNHQDLVWKLLVNIAPKDILFMYWYDKEEFYKQFKSWDDSMKEWAIETICNNI